MHIYLGPLFDTHPTLLVFWYTPLPCLKSFAVQKTILSILIDSDGTVIPPDADPNVILEDFAETWEVEESDWVFSLYEYTVQIENDTELGKGLVPQYEANFATEAERIKAETVWK